MRSRRSRRWRCWLVSGARRRPLPARLAAGRCQGHLRMARWRPASARAFDRGDAGGARRRLCLRLRRRQLHLLPALHRRPERLPHRPNEHRYGEWKLSREGEPFNQRFTATISEDGAPTQTRCRRASYQHGGKTPPPGSTQQVSGIPRSRYGLVHTCRRAERACPQSVASNSSFKCRAACLAD